MERIKFRYKGRIVEGELIEEVQSAYHPSAYKVMYDGRYIKVMPSEVVK